MMTFTRRVNESLIINDDIRITVMHLRGQRVRLQVEAPDHVKVRRDMSRYEVSEGPEPGRPSTA